MARQLILVYLEVGLGLEVSLVIYPCHPRLKTKGGWVNSRCITE